MYGRTYVSALRSESPVAPGCCALSVALDPDTSCDIGVVRHHRTHRRRSTRLVGYDYAARGAYFITIRVQHGLPLLGRVVDGRMRLSPAGRRASWWWMELARRFALSVDSFVIMPNHLHGIVVLRDPCSELGDVVRWFKIMTTSEYMRRVREAGWARFPGRLWLRGYYDHVIRHSRALDAIRGYILSNPSRTSGRC